MELTKEQRIVLATVCGTTWRAGVLRMLEGRISRKQFDQAVAGLESLGLAKMNKGGRSKRYFLTVTEAGTNIQVKLGIRSCNDDGTVRLWRLTPIIIPPPPIDPELEPCCFCGTATIYWTAIPDREPGEQVACCPACSHSQDWRNVPMKEAWFAKPQGLYK